MLKYWLKLYLDNYTVKVQRQLRRNYLLSLVNKTPCVSVIKSKDLNLRNKRPYGHYSLHYLTEDVD